MAQIAKSRVVVLAGGISHERDVSLRSGRRVADSLAEQGIEVELRDPDSTILAYLQASRPDVVWPALHGASGEDGALRGLLEFLDIPFVGSRADAARLAWDKPTAKVLVARQGISTPRSITLPREAFRELGATSVLDSIADELPIPVVVKPARGGSAQGVTLVDDIADLPRAMVDAYTYGDVALIEQKIVGTEIAVGIIDTGDGPVALPRGRDRSAVGRVQLRGPLQRRRDPVLHPGTHLPRRRRPGLQRPPSRRTRPSAFVTSRVST